MSAYIRAVASPSPPYAVVYEEDCASSANREATEAESRAADLFFATILCVRVHVSKTDWHSGAYAAVDCVVYRSPTTTMRQV